MLFKLEPYYYSSSGYTSAGYVPTDRITYIMQDKIIAIEVSKSEYSTIQTITEIYIIKTERASEIVTILDNRRYGCK